MHREVSVKVNSWVDCGIAPLVAAMNEFDEILTVDSCEGGDDAPAYVYFIHHGDAEQASAFVIKLSALLGTRLHSCCDYKLRLEWTPGAEQPLGEILTNPSYVDTLANALVGAASIHRSSVSVDGT